MFPQIDNIRKVQFEEKKLKAFFLSFFFFYLFIYDTVFIYLHRTNYIQDFVFFRFFIFLSLLFTRITVSLSYLEPCFVLFHLHHPSSHLHHPPTWTFVLLVCPNTSSHHMVTYYLFDCRSESDFMSTPVGSF